MFPIGKRMAHGNVDDFIGCNPVLALRSTSPEITIKIALWQLIYGKWTLVKKLDTHSNACTKCLAVLRSPTGTYLLKEFPILARYIFTVIMNEAGAFISYFSLRRGSSLEMHSACVKRKAILSSGEALSGSMPLRRFLFVSVRIVANMLSQLSAESKL